MCGLVGGREIYIESHNKIRVSIKTELGEIWNIWSKLWPWAGRMCANFHCVLPAVRFV